MTLSQTISVHDVGGYLESACLPGTWPLFAGSPEFPGAAARPPVDRLSAASAHPLPQSASSPCALAALGEGRHPQGRSLLRKRRNATQTLPVRYEHTYSPPHG